MSARVTWPEWGGILATCTMSGTVLAALAFWVRTPWSVTPLAVPVAASGALAGGLIVPRYAPMVRARSGDAAPSS